MERDRLDRNFLVLIFGLPGSGKSTLANKLGKELRTDKVIDVDEVVIQESERRGSCSGTSEIDWKSVHKDENYLLEYIKKGYKRIVVEDVFPLKSSRNKVRTLCKKYEYNYIEILIDENIDVCWERIKLRNIHDSSHVVIGEETFNKMVEIFEKPIKLDSYYLIHLHSITDIDISVILNKIEDIFKKYDEYSRTESIATDKLVDNSVNFKVLLENRSRVVLGDIIKENIQKIRKEPKLTSLLNNKRRELINSFKNNNYNDVEECIEIIRKGLLSIFTI